MDRINQSFIANIAGFVSQYAIKTPSPSQIKVETSEYNHLQMVDIIKEANFDFQATSNSMANTYLQPSCKNDIAIRAY